mmetsp:Transcript_21738/g.64007  ORF Transcript_21738/g.64007 Transcript_21738/m.64007 type:complete len:512 (-) Transcript_21738:69-1604(-)
MTTIRRPKGRGVSAVRNPSSHGATGDRNLALIVVALVLLVALGPFLLMGNHPPDDDASAPSSSSSFGFGNRGRTPRGRAAELAEARARRNGYRHIIGRGGSSRLKVYVYPDIRAIESEGRLLRFLNDGVASSSPLELTDVPDGDNTAWLVDLTRAKCKDLVPHVQEILGRRMTAARNRAYPPEAGPDDAAVFRSDLLWPIYILDFSDYGYVLDDDGFYNINDLTTDCIRPLSDLLGKRNTFFASRQHMSGREITYEVEDGDRDEDNDEREDSNVNRKKMDEAKLIGELGEFIDYDKLFCANVMSGTVRQIHFGARDIMRDSMNKASGGVGDPSLIPRPMDVAYFWKIGDDDVGTGNHRDRVRDVLLEMAAADGADGGIKVHADAIAKGLGSIKKENVTDVVASEMLQYKILVLAQKDHYEDNYRLMDALLSGNLVMTDPMHPLPLGLRDGESIVVYHSMSDLKQKIIQYLSHDEERQHIGRRGREVALKYHNPKSWVERIIFGNWSSIMGA